jgi:hypothetical protein
MTAAELAALMKGTAMLPSRPSRRLLLSLAAVTVAGTAIVGGSSLASASSTGVAKSAVNRAASTVVSLENTVTPADTATPTDTAETPEPGALEGLGDVMIDCPAIDMTAVNDEQRELADYLTERGIAFTIETTDGFDWVVPTGTDEATMNALDDFYWQKYPMPAEVIEQINADTRRLVDFLREQGFEVAIITDRHGLTSPDLSEIDAAMEEALNAYYSSQFPYGGAILDPVGANVIVSQVIPIEGDVSEFGDLPELIELPEFAELPEFDALPEFDELPEFAELPEDEAVMIGCAFAGPVVEATDAVTINAVPADE